MSLVYQGTSLATACGQYKFSTIVHIKADTNTGLVDMRKTWQVRYKE